MAEEIVTDVLVVGAGAAGLCAAIAARKENAETLIASISSLGAGNATAVAGGLINAAVGPGDSPETHFDDSVGAGVSLNDRRAIARVVEEMPRWLPTLEEYGVHFQKDEDGYALIRSPGHTRPRTLLFSPRLGTSLSKPLAETAQRLGARSLVNFNVVKVLVQDGRAVGAIGYDCETDRVVHVAAKAVILATGGASLIYSRTKIPPGVPGDGYGMALDAGLTLQDMEFVQFYPTVLAEPGMAKMLIVYDYFLKQGGVFRNSPGEDIVVKHGLPEPAMITRDQLSIAIGKEVHAGLGIDGGICLDPSGIVWESADLLFRNSLFARLVKERKERGDDLTARPIRVAPANHFYMGGAMAGPSGETSVEGLLVCGEAAGGTHGANRLQGNALAETVVMGFAAGRAAGVLVAGSRVSKAPVREVGEVEAQVRAALNRTSGTPIRDILLELQSIMSAKVGLIRDGQGLREAKVAIDDLRQELPRAVATAPRERAQLSTLANVLATAECIVVSALARRESRGAQYRVDHPELGDEAWIKHITCQKRGDGIAVGSMPVKLD